MLSVAIFGWDTPGNGILLAGMFIVATLFWGGVAWLIEFDFGVSSAWSDGSEEVTPCYEEERKHPPYIRANWRHYSISKKS